MAIEGPNPLDLARLAEGQKLEGVLPVLEPEVMKMIDSLEARVFAAINRGELTPEMAQSAWMERYAYSQLLRRLTKTVQIGKSAAEQVKPHMDGGRHAKD